MINPNRDTSEDVLRRLKEASYERVRIEVKNSIEILMRDFDMTWDDVGQLLGLKVGPENFPSQGDRAKKAVIENDLTLVELNELTAIFSCEPYVIFRPRNPWTKT